MSWFNFQHSSTHVVNISINFVLPIMFLCKFFVQIVGLVINLLLCDIFLISFGVILLIFSQLANFLHVVLSHVLLSIFISLLLKFFSFLHELLLDLLLFLNVSPRKFVGLVLDILQVLSFGLNSLLFFFILVLSRLFILEVS